MIRLEETCQVPTPIDAAYDYVANFDSIEQWDPGVAESERLDSGPLEVGARFRVVTDFRGRRSPMTYTLVEHKPPVRVVLEGDGPTIAATDTITFDSDADGTRITYVAELRPKGLLRLATPFMGRIFDRIGKDAVAGLEHALRTRAGDVDR